MNAELLDLYEQAAQAEQEQALDASPDPGHDLDEDAEAWHDEIRGLCGV